jgi:hypothetical protein
MDEMVFENWLDLKTIYHKLQKQYAVELSTGLALNAGFDWDMEVLTGKSILGRFYLYFNGMDAVLDYNTEYGMSSHHWHPADNDEALDYVVRFMEGTLL